jgi:hypothetical protein
VIGITSESNREYRYTVNESEANRTAHAFLCKHIDLEQCNELPNGLYEFKPSEEFLFKFRLFGHSSIGSSEYIAVSKETEVVRYVGFHEE